MASTPADYRNTRRIRRLRERCSEAQGHRCAYCSILFGTGRARCTLDHYQARSHGGPLTYWNCVAACAGCNGERGTENPQVFWRRKMLQRIAPMSGLTRFAI